MAKKDNKGNLHSENNGQFISKEEQEAKRQEAEKIYNSEPQTTEPRNDELDRQEKSPSLDELLGEEFKGYKGQQAVDKLLQEKRGHVKGAFHREDIGDIDLLWGNDSLGLQHIINQRDGEKEGHAQEIMDHLSIAIEKGEFKQKNDRGNFVFAYKEGNVQYRTVIAPEYHNNKITYVLTAFRRGKRR